MSFALNKKDSRKNFNEKEAVSAIIGVILMVAITVVIAATIYVYVSGMIATSTQRAPNMQLNQDAENKKLTVVSADLNLNCDDFEISLNGIVQDDSPGKPPWQAHFIGNNPPDSTVTAGDIIQLKPGDGHNGIITIVHIPTNTLVGSWEFV